MSFLKGNVGDILGTISPGLGALTGKGLGAGMMPMISPLGALLGLGKSGGGGDGAEQPAPPPPNGAARGLGNLIGVDPARISSIAGDVGRASNSIAQSGGAAGGYAAPELPDVSNVRNHLQLLDPSTLQALIRHFSGKPGQI